MALETAQPPCRTETDPCRATTHVGSSPHHVSTTQPDEFGQSKRPCRARAGHEPIRLATDRRNPKPCARNRFAPDVCTFRIPSGPRTHSSVSSHGREAPCPCDRG